MAHFAQLDEDNIVMQVIVVSNDDIMDNNGIESEDLGVKFCKMLLGSNTRWVQTSYNSNFRKRYARIGMFYDAQRDVFYYPNPYPDEWIFDETNMEYVTSE
jgi:hypothetical protein